jgi:hypothetical protein
MRVVPERRTDPRIWRRVAIGRPVHRTSPTQPRDGKRRDRKYYASPDQPEGKAVSYLTDQGSRDTDGEPHAVNFLPMPPRGLGRLLNLDESTTKVARQMSGIRQRWSGECFGEGLTEVRQREMENLRPQLPTRT